MITFGIFLLLCIFAPILAVVFVVVWVVAVILLGLTK